jgi:mRNA-capping enzyme
LCCGQAVSCTTAQLIICLYLVVVITSHGETPSRENTTLFLNIVENFIRNNPLDSIGVHCTHGFNRSGFLICAYLVEKLDYSVDMAVALFAEARPPGIYKEEYVRELFARYADDPSMVLPPVPELPTWDVEDADLIDDDGEDEDESNRESAVANGNGRGADSENGNNGRQRQKRPRREESKLNPQFAEPTLMGVEACMDPNEVARARQLTQSICEWNGYAIILLNYRIY